MIKNKCVYCHLTPENEVFYIGKGSVKRAYTPHGRKRAWRDIAKNSYTVKIIKDGLSEAESLALVRELIKQYGRVWNNTGILVNKTCGTELQKCKKSYKKVYDTFRDRKVKNYMTDEVYNSVTDVAIIHNLHVNTVIRHLERIQYVPKLTITYLR